MLFYGLYKFNEFEKNNSIAFSDLLKVNEQKK